MAQAADSEDQYLSSAHHAVTILALRMSSRKRLGMYLNQDAMPLQSGLLPNYQGLAECIGFEFIEQLSFQREKDPTQSLLMEWGNRPEFEPTLGNLVKYLLDLERVDVLEDCREIIRNDAEHYLNKKAAGSSEITPVQDSTVSQSPFNIDDMKVDETTIMTIQDVEAGGPTYYDAFVCYNAEGEDLAFVKLMIEKMECPPHNLKLFVPHRDDLPGASKYVISAKLIQDRCKRMVIVMSPRYLKSDACDFQTKFAHALSPGSRSKKLVPVLVTYCPTPNILRHVTMCDYTRGDLTGWFWDRLIKSLQAPLDPHEIMVDNPGSLSHLEMSLDSQPDNFSSPSASPSSSLGAQPKGQASRGTISLPVTTPVSSLSPSSATSSPITDKKGGAKVKSPHTVALPVSPPASSGCPSPGSERKSGAKKKGLRSKLTAVFSSSHSS